VAVMMLYEAMLAGNGGDNPFLALANASQDQSDGPSPESRPAAEANDGRPTPSPNAANRPGASPGPRRRPS
jgi:hypothetical protein